MHRSFNTFFKHSTGSQKANSLVVQRSQTFFTNRGSRAYSMSKFTKGLLLVGGVSLAYTAGQYSNDDINAYNAPKEQSLPDAKKTGPSTDRFHFISQVHMIPHPKKAYKGGEDAYFVSDDGNALGVADGVGGWESKGVDPSIYSRTFMQFAKEAYESFILKNKMVEPSSILQYAWEKCQGIIGSSTACVIVLNPEKKIIKTGNVGDSGFVIIRDGNVMYHSPQQQFRFNFPYQLGSNNVSKPSSADLQSFEMKEGDVIVLGSDGVFDNLYDNDILAIVKKAFDNKKQIGDVLKNQQLAQEIAKTAHEKAKDKNYFSPFAKGAAESGKKYSGGKMDDITVIVAVISTGIAVPKSKL